MSIPDNGAAKRKLPIGIQTFREVRGEGYYYVDKTAHIQRMTDGGKHYFLSRPRRFGKSLLLDTMKELFEGSEELFQGLAVHDQWDWSVHHPVLRVSFGSGHFGKPGQLEALFNDKLDAVERSAGVASAGVTAAGRFAALIEALQESAGRRVAVLIDEYDKPILDALEAPEVARANRDFLRGIYSVIKDCDAHVRFTFLTGVSKFSKVSLFSGLNNLTDITLDPRYSAVCGYTEGDLDAVFAPELPGFDRDEVRHWHNGYSWRGGEKVYNPFDILLLFRQREFKAHRFETGSPKFLIDTLLPDAARRRADDAPLRELLAANDFAGLEAFFRTVFAGVPHQWHVRNDIREYEGYYASVVYSCFAAQGFDLVPEESSSTGRADMVVRFDGGVYVFEFKSVGKGASGRALAQIKERGYADKYRHLGRPVHLIGVEFSREDRNIAAFEVSRAA